MLLGIWYRQKGWLPRLAAEFTVKSIALCALVTSGGLLSVFFLSGRLLILHIAAYCLALTLEISSSWAVAHRFGGFDEAY